MGKYMYSCSAGSFFVDSSTKRDYEVIIEFWLNDNFIFETSVMRNFVGVRKEDEVGAAKGNLKKVAILKLFN